MRCVWRTAFGNPVVPELKTSTASASGSSTTARDRGAADGRRAVEVEHRRRRERVRQRAAPGGVAHRDLRRHDPARVLHLGGLPRRAEHHDRRAQLQRAVHREHELRPVVRHRARRGCRGSTPTAANDALPLVGAGLHLAERVGAVLEVERHPIAIARRPVAQHLGQRPPVHPVAHRYRSSRRGSCRVARIVVPSSRGRRLDDPSTPSSTNARLM